MVLDLALALPSRGFRVEVCCTSKLGARAEAARDLGVVVRDCSPGPLRIPGLPLKLAWSFPNPPDVLHAHGGAWRAAALAKTFLRAPRLVFTVHGLAGPQARWRTWFERWCAGRTDALAAVSPEVAEELANRLGRQGAAEVIPNGIPLGAPAAARPETRRGLSIAEGEILILAVGRLEPVKDHATLLRAFARAAAQAPALRLSLVGSGGLETDLRSQAVALGLGSRVQFLGHREDVPSLLRAADLFAITSASEGHPVALLEAMAAGLPAVASAVAGNEEALGAPPAGLLFEPGNDGELAKALLRLAGDEPLRRDLSERGKERAAAFSVDAMVDRYSRLYQLLLEQRR
jgi:glycosyltransferase involved in cell wall biosynthesis